MYEITLKYPPQLLALWRNRRVQDVWFWEFRGLFDELDLKNARGLQGKRGYHFGEWFAAIYFYKKGYRVLTEKYTIRSRRAKLDKLKPLIGSRIERFLLQNQEKFNWPDLLVIDPDHGFTFFAEAKMPWDDVSDDQRWSFREIEKLTRCPVAVVRIIPE